MIIAYNFNNLINSGLQRNCFYTQVEMDLNNYRKIKTNYKNISLIL